MDVLVDIRMSFVLVGMFLEWPCATSCREEDKNIKFGKHMKGEFFSFCLNKEIEAIEPLQEFMCHFVSRWHMASDYLGAHKCPASVVSIFVTARTMSPKTTEPADFNYCWMRGWHFSKLLYVFILYVKFAIVLLVQIRPADCATTSWLCYALLRNVSFLFVGNFIVFTSNYAS